MISPDYVRQMARYNAWQNANLYGCADQLSEEERKRERGAFFGSVQGTLAHLLFGDQTWMHRLTGSPKPRAGSIAESVHAYPNWLELKAERTAFDAVISEWAASLDQSALEGDLRWFSGLAQRDFVMPRWVLVSHMFNHQTHHRGQVHCMLTQAGKRPGITDMLFAPPEGA